MGTLLIMRFTLLETLRRWLLPTMVLLTLLLLGVFALLLDSFVTSITARFENARTIIDANIILITILSVWAVHMLSSALTVVLTINAISGEVEAGTFATLVSKPLRRVEIVFGKWAGYALVLSVYTALLFCSFLGIIYLRTGYYPEQAPSALLMLELSVLALLGLTTFNSAFVPTLVNGAIVFVFFISAPIASLIQTISATYQSGTIENVTTIINLVIPTDALWHGAAYYLIPPSILALFQQQENPAALNTPFTSSQPIAPGLLAWSVFYLVVLPILGALRFRKRDL
jgi:ABC-type transport system involved in multi-copper enzyme maturation permease subunit